MEIYRIRDEYGSLVVDKSLIEDNPEWYYLSKSWKIDSITTYEYMRVEDEIIYVPASLFTKLKIILGLKDKITYTPRSTVLEVRVVK